MIILIAWIRALNDAITFTRIPIPPSKSSSSSSSLFSSPTIVSNYNDSNSNGNGWRSLSVDGASTRPSIDIRDSQKSIKVKVGGFSEANSNYQLMTSVPLPSLSSSSSSSSRIDFSANSGTIFTCAGDVAMILDQLGAQPTVVPGINAAAKELSSRGGMLLRLLTEVKVNKEAAVEFGDRVQDIIRIIGEPHAGLLTKLKNNSNSNNDYNTIQVNLINLCGKLSDATTFIETQVSVGWFVNALSKV